MERIASFTVDHTTLDPGMYVSRVDGDITTYDMRCVKPNAPRLLTNAEMHTFEHMFATAIRNGEIGGSVIYFGPMGCQTGFYLLVRNADEDGVNSAVSAALSYIRAYEGEVFGNTPQECGNYKNLRLDDAKTVAAVFARAFKGIEKYKQ